jgi:hypothetical protein
MKEDTREELADFLRFCSSERRLAAMTCAAYERDVSACLDYLQGQGIEVHAWFGIAPTYNELYDGLPRPSGWMHSSSRLTAARGRRPGARLGGSSSYGRRRASRWGSGHSANSRPSLATPISASGRIVSLRRQRGPC